MIHNDETIGKVRFILCDDNHKDFMVDEDLGKYHLGIVDPPYGIGAANMNFGKTTKIKDYYSSKTHKTWDESAPPPEYWKDLFRITRNQLVWGANYFFEHLPNSECVYVWDKEQAEELSFDDFELCWTSFKTKSKIIKRSRAKDASKEKIHKTQKPVWLYRKLLVDFAKPGQRILDTHGGSHTIAIACQQFGCYLTVTERVPDFHFKGIENLKKFMINQELNFNDL